MLDFRRRNVWHVHNYCASWEILHLLLDYSAIWRVRRSIFLFVCKFLLEERTTSVSERYVEEACLKLILPLYNVCCFFKQSELESFAKRYLARPLGRDWISSGLFPAMSFIAAALQIWFLSLITRRFVSFNCDKEKRKVCDWPNVGVMRL